MKNQRDRMLLVLINVYIFATILYYVFLRNIVDTLPIVALLGGHVNYYALIGALCLTEAHPAMQGFITSVMVVGEIAYPLLLLFSYFIAIRKRKYKFFAGMVIFNIVFLLTMTILCFYVANANWLLSTSVWADILGNSLYSYVLFRLICKKNCVDYSEA